MIIWRNGKAGFVGASKTFIKGVFTFQHAVNVAVVTTPSITFSAVKPTRGYSAIKPIRGHTAIKPKRDYVATKIVNILDD